MITVKSIIKYMYISRSLIYLTHPDHRIRYAGGIWHYIDYFMKLTIK